MPNRKSGTTSSNADRNVNNGILSLVWEDMSRASYPVALFQKENDFWFLAKDVCEILNIDVSDIGKFVNDLPANQKQKKSAILGNSAGHRDVWFISEAGLYQAIFKSSSTNARPFQTWVTNEVLPEIRRTGEYNGGAAAKPATESLNIQEILSMMIAEREDASYIVAKVDGKYRIHEWDKHTFLTAHQQTVFDMLVLFFTRAFVNYSAKGLMKYVPKDAAELGEVRDLDWIIGSCLLPFLNEITANAILPAREQGKKAAAGKDGAQIGNPGEDPSMVRLKRLGLISDNGKGGYVVNKKRLIEYAEAMKIKIPEVKH